MYFPLPSKSLMDNVLEGFQFDTLRWNRVSMAIFAFKILLFLEKSKALNSLKSSNKSLELSF